MATTYKAIATVTVGSGGAANIEFTSIPGTYTDLVVKFSLRTVASLTWDEIQVTFNSNTSSYSERLLYGTGSSAGSTSGSTRQFFIANGDTATANTFGNGEIYIPNYAGSNNKSVSGDTVNENNGSTAYIYLNAMLWSNSAAITSIKLASSNSANLKQYSTATLYGIKNS
jgi:hypothetical protein